VSNKSDSLPGKKIFVIVAVAAIILLGIGAGAVLDRTYGIKILDRFLPKTESKVSERIVLEENDVIDVVKKVGPSVVTVSATQPARQIIQFSPFGGISQRNEDSSPQDIGTGFVVSEDGLIITNKHVVADAGLKYQVNSADGKTYEVKEVIRDPNNDIAVLKIDALNLRPVELGDSSNLQVGQFVIAIGTALGEFRNTVTTGVVSGLGRGIDAGSSYQGYVERLDNVIQTDAAINPGNSGGPLLNSAGQVVGINVAVAQGADNIAFAIPINTVKDALDTYKSTGKFPAKAYLGVEYQTISKQAALLNNVPQGVYIVNVIEGSPAQKEDVRVGDIIYKVDNSPLGTDTDSLSRIISSKKPGDGMVLTIWRDGETKDINVTLSEFQQ